MTDRYRIATIFLLGFFLDCVNLFMSAVALPAIAQRFDVSVTSAAWVANAYILGLTLSMPLAPWLAERFGARRLLSLSMLTFSLAAAAAGAAHGYLPLVAARLLQGLGGGLLIPVGQALAFAAFPGTQRARVSTLVMGTALLAPALSPSLGGWLVDHWGWPWVFWVNVPFGLLIALLAWRWVDDTRQPGARPDLRGLVLLCALLAALLLGLSGVGLPVVFLALAAVLALAYRRHARRTPQPVLATRLLGNPNLRLSVGLYQAVPGVFTGISLLNLFYLQRQLGWSATHAGALMLLYASGALLAILLAGRLYNRLGAARLFRYGLLLHSAGIGLLALVGPEHGWPLLVAAYLLMGCGGGLVANTAQTCALLDFHGAELRRASLLWNLNRQFAFCLGAALFSLLYSLLQTPLGEVNAYRGCFLVGALIGLLALPSLQRLAQSPNPAPECP
ncbi:MAG: putative transport protein HsrA [Stenotrophomonas maltophilia]|nr:MAG: putative transport protein HsrA [Stenotrophomonas maltophilia]